MITLYTYTGGDLFERLVARTRFEEVQYNPNNPDNPDNPIAHVIFTLMITLAHVIFTLMITP